ncbi:MAG: NAD-binding protein [Candidatus Micrarchaeales archaeon]|jgi:Kef-type K+ transport systems, predicted NAD-binding component|uniref:TrkA-N domain protein n=1 Tax=Candidatus Micrarchaeum acidiphilum ARMAN-2 TaxID=425595 RepID=C7DGS3_MICA2|nr:MAG: TrkA-N domain protein [Candidatus Micrarchaeum acidiphilum ARMAN-2]MCW6161528.1 NAD-binding protein [Candidatus Micrarchaeales archaeon]
MAEKKNEMKNHVVVCGYGVVGQKIVEILSEHKVPLIVIEIEPKICEKLKSLEYQYIEGDATQPKVLKDAGIMGAKAVAFAMDNDAKNLFAVLTARDLNKDIFITTRANDARVRDKMVEAGADYIVMPQKSASKEILEEILK